MATQPVAQRRERRHLFLVAGLGLLAGVLTVIALIASDGGAAVNGRLLLVMGLAVGVRNPASRRLRRVQPSWTWPANRLTAPPA